MLRKTVFAVLISALSISPIVTNAQAAKAPDTSKLQFVDPTNRGWTYFDGYWVDKQVGGWGTVKIGSLESEPGQYHYGREAAISTNSPVAVLKQRGVFGGVTVYVDGVKKFYFPFKGKGEYDAIPIYSGLKGWHTIKLTYSLLPEVDGLYVAKGSKVKRAAVPAKKLVILGHSYVEGASATNMGETNFASLLGPMLGVQSVNQGIGATDVDVEHGGVKNGGLDRWQQDVVSERPDYVLIDYGINAISEITYKQESDQLYQAHFTQLLRDIRGKLPNVPIFVSGIIAVPWADDAGLSKYNQDIQNAVKAVPGCHFIDLSGDWNSSNFAKYISADHTHPTDAGHQYLAQKYAAAIKYFLAHPNDNGVKQTVTGSVYGN